MEQDIDILAKAKAELSSIDGQIAALRIRQDELKKFIDLGARLFSPPEGSVLRIQRTRPDAIQLNDGAKSHLKITVERMRREHSMKARILELSKHAITEKGPQSTRELLAYIEAAGVEVTGADKPTTVSVILSRSQDFKSDRTLGWTLVPVQKELTP